MIADYFFAVVLGAIEGVTEFLPISSTAHLRIAQHFLGLPLRDPFWKLFAVFIQIGAIGAVAALYRKRLASLNREGIILIGLAFVSTAIPALLLKKAIAKNLESLGLMAGALIAGGVIMIAVDLIFGEQATIDRPEDMGRRKAVFIGLIQTLSAIFPGLSRSMSTIAAGQIAGLSRPAALEFSFLVSIPVMFAATFYDLAKYGKEGVELALSGHQIGVLVVGTLVSFWVAYAVVGWFLDYVRERGFTPFGIYRILLGALLLALR